ncbi:MULTISPECIES: bifunctional D-glycero-beta-D-manno-heptose-7-phosphate kinase/D-glycero-beta-D-manno-heptose 1-phosphate adenylyltransferase HldE [unclassified Azospirillum]|uniref:bifunctional D-glycero-beta-D-manno-heptose-7-phosphate kinase/D-glycero-beta-D-manno-heptose 1-phosphate adenylyltransferase HldE n=1 Tax=unclassified Azospirillum TaxID=2630922 RepID=UPI000B6D0E64|nr:MULTISPECIES: bifunctional D-glycero-beta-D-manno-heptose-7-phosphate kinase/D-glycero-beta-D-manno-heptose 1-phosphate adenylyltransferase HldE [unclassified Azospirillum]SNR94566.1 D-alpha,beta-D-heptose 7-phosphate 1-kinase /D-beta-D-heptose 1-phosphate adenylyltransferase [Azospirillum sp. RU38E]SNS10685.1 D-alpha,beta-D-heptose 7-phosphate 1-kinase /D-beta-D-heptose 1-phosphate adenylyltransferase [Azospirillum sp. RU37A]
MSLSLAEILASLAGARVTIIGDVMLDRFIYGDIARISPEAPVPVLKYDHAREMLGGAGNVAANARSLGADVVLIGLVGEDAAGSTARRLAGPAARLLARGDGPTTVKTRMIARQQQMLRLDEEKVGPPTADEAAGLLAALNAALPDSDVILLSDYAKGVLAGDLPQRIIAAAKGAGKQVIVDPKGRDFARYRGADLVTPNLTELRLASGADCEDDTGVVDAARDLLTRHALGAIIVTRSEQGMSVVTADAAVHLPTMAREVFDVSGAGDTVVAMLACALSRGAALADAARLANAAAGIVVGKQGTAQVTPGELALALRQQDAGDIDAKIASQDEASAIAAQWRERGLRVGFTNGCFDLLHPGHLSLLRQARAACDRLIVGMNDDASVRRLKGESRPIQNQDARAAVLASLQLVDLVVPFTQDTPLELIQLVRPDVLVKGADYRIDQVVGADFVQGLGGRVLLANLKEGFSTTRTVARITGKGS